MKLQKQVKVQSTKEWIGVKYYWFLLRNALRRKTTWFITILFIFILSIFLVFLPLSLKTDPFSFWTNSFINPQMFMMYIGSLLAAVLSISVFQDYIENGTELIITSKPITRIKMTFVKFCVVLTLITIFCIICVLFGPLIYFSFDVSWSLCSALILSILLSNFSFLLLFTSIATLCSMSMSKVWIFIVNFSITLLMVIFSITARFAVLSPAQVVLKDDKHQIGTYSMQNNDGKYLKMASLNKLYTSMEQMESDYSFLQESDLDPNNFDPQNLAKYFGIVDDGADSYIQFKIHPGEHALYDNDSVQRFWDQSCDKSKVGISNVFNFSQQFQHMNNLFGLQEEEKTTATYPFGSDPFFNNEITGKSVFQNLPNSTDPNAPAYYVSLSGYKGNYSKGYENITDSTPNDKIPGIISNNLTNLYKFVLPQMLDGSQIGYYGGAGANQVNATLSLVDSINVTENNNDPIIAKARNLSENLSQMKAGGGITKSDTVTSKTEEQLFTEMVRAFIYTDKTMQHVRYQTDIDQDIEPFFWDDRQIYYDDIDDRIPHNANGYYIPDLFHYWLLEGAPKEFNNDVDWKENPLGIKNDAQLLLEMIKFKTWYYNNIFTKTNTILPNNVTFNVNTQTSTYTPISDDQSIYDYYKPWFGSENDQSIFAIGDGVQQGNPYFGNFIDYDDFKNIWINAGKDLEWAIVYYLADPSPSNLTELKKAVNKFIGNESTFSHITLTANKTGTNNQGYYNSTLNGSFNTNEGSYPQIVTYNTYTEAFALRNYLNSSLDKYGYDHLGSYNDVEEWAKDFNRTNRNTSWINKNYISIYNNAERTLFSYDVKVKMPFYLISLCWLCFSIVAVGASFAFYYKKDIK